MKSAFMFSKLVLLNFLICITEKVTHTSKWKAFVPVHILESLSFSNPVNFQHILPRGAMKSVSYKRAYGYSLTFGTKIKHPV
jgi:hypothetical protein